jgi:inner membrane protein
MDNLCHTLVGAAFGEAGLKQHSRFGSATLMIAANLPDVDVLVFGSDVPSVAFRRGWTHGILAQIVLPLLLAGLVFMIDRRRPARPGSDATRSTSPRRASLPALIMLSYAGVLSHVFLDFLNNYGVRLLMPFSGRWFYGDALFIIDPWLWLILGAGVLVARTRRRWRLSAARVSLVVAAAYVAAMLASAHAARIFVHETWRAERGRDARALMVGPLPVTPLRKQVIVDAGDHYETGTFAWFPRRVTFDPEVVPKRDEAPAVLVARNTDPRLRGILVWSRFPFYVVAPAPGGVRVMLRDMRFTLAGRGGFAATVFVPAGHEESQDK